MKEISVKADKEIIDQVFEFVEGELETIEGIKRMDILKIHMLVDEIFSNIASYAYEDEPGEVSIALFHDSEAESVSITFRDRGRPYNPLEQETPDVSLPVKKRRPGGLGVFMVRNTVDDIHYENTDGQNVLTIVKKTGGNHA